MSVSADIFAAARAQGRSALDEPAGKKLLADFGIRVPRSVVVSDAAKVNGGMSALQGPYVVKVVSPDILHKSDVGGVRLGLKSAAHVAQAIAEMAKSPQISGARVEGWLVEEMAPAGQEIVIGAVRDPQFGPLMMVGLGGIFVEVLADVAFRICPLTRLDAQEMLAELKGAAVLRGARGGKVVSQDAIIDVLLKVGGEDGLMARHGGDIKEADINPLIVNESGAIAADARFVLA